MSRTIIAIPALVGIISGATLLPPTSERAQLHRRPAILTTLPTVNLEFAEPARSWVENHCQFGIPELESRHPYGPTWIVPHEGFVLQLSVIDKIPLWVCERVDHAQLQGQADRQDVFADDPLVPDHLEARQADYSRTGYDRGHQAPAGNQVASQRLKNETFYYSNMSPQKPWLNRSIWRRIEEWLRDRVVDGSPVFIVTGPIFYDPLEENPQTADGLVEYYSIGNGVSVPTHFYKIAIQNRGGTWRSIAFVLENRDHERSERIEDFRQSVDWIEERTGIDFFPELDAQRIEELEEVIAPFWNE